MLGNAEGVALFKDKRGVGEKRKSYRLPEKRHSPIETWLEARRF